MARRTYGIHTKRSHAKLIVVLVSILVLVGASAAVYMFVLRGDSEPKKAPAQVTKKQTPAETSETKATVVTFSKVDLQPTLDSWLAGKSVDYGVEVYDVANETVIAAYQPDKQYFTASIYKMYVAYLTYQRLQSGEYTEQANFLGSQSLLDCQHAMIYTSDSPCGEAVMAKLTQETMGKELKTFGTTNTNFPGFVTTAHDANVVLRRLALEKDLKPEWSSKMLTSMKTQVYSRGLMKGFSGAVVASKVGFNEDINFHEVGIVTYPNGRQYLVSIFSQGQGSSSPLASLSSALNATITATQ